MDHSKHNMGKMKMESTPKPVAKWIMLRIKGETWKWMILLKMDNMKMTEADYDSNFQI
jgi:hypothetical protein